MTKAKADATASIKKLLASETNTAANDWKRLSKRDVSWNDIDREFENKTTGEKLWVTERPNGLVYAQRDNEQAIMGRISPAFNTAAQLSPLDKVMSLILADADEIDDTLYASAVKQGLARQFSFVITQNDTGEEDEPLFANIYPTLRDETFKCPAYIRPLVPELQAIDECMTTEWHFPAQFDAPLKLAQYLLLKGFTLDEESQKRATPTLYDEVMSAFDTDLSRTIGAKRKNAL